jgi:sulfur-oxidizing protein SoxA
MRLLLALAIVMLAAPALPAPARAQAPLALEGSAAPTPWQRYRDWNKTRWDNYNTLAKPNVTPPHGAEIVLKDVTGDPETGRKLAFDRNRGGGCLACHVMGPKTLEAPGNVGPDLSAAATSGCSTTYTTRGSTIPSR